MADKRLTTPGSDKTFISYMANQTQHMPVGWCNHRKHKGKLSVKQMKSHECLKKQCVFFVKNEKHQYWEYRDQHKQSKKKAKYLARFGDILCEEIKRSLDKLIPKR
jgi:hypothetical protein